MTDVSLRVFDSVLDMLSNENNPTPIVRLNRVVPFKHTKVYAKLEWYNPFGAVKDRVAANLVRDAEARGVKLENLVEPTSGNTGMGLAMISNDKKLNFTATLSLAIPAEKRAVLRAFGAKLVELADDLCPMPGAPEGAMQKATDLAQQPGWHQLNQYKNPANPDAHFRTTGPEVWKQTAGKITHFVAGMGTCGTITGTGRFLKSKNKDVKVLGVHPAEGHDIPGVRSLRALRVTDFFLPQEYDGVIEIGNEDAYRLCKRLIQEECIIAGPSSGMALAGALKLVPDEPGAICVVVFPDNVFKYTGSIRKHLPELFPAEAGSTALRQAQGPERSRGANSPPGGQASASPVLSSADEIEPVEAANRIRQGAVLFDVRTPDEYKSGHIAEALNLPLQAIQAGVNGAATAGALTQHLPADKEAAIVTICAVGKRSMAACQLLKGMGYGNVKTSRGGMNAWVSEGHSLQIR